MGVIIKTQRFPPLQVQLISILYCGTLLYGTKALSFYYFSIKTYTRHASMQSGTSHSMHPVLILNLTIQIVSNEMTIPNF